MGGYDASMCARRLSAAAAQWCVGMANSAVLLRPFHTRYLILVSCVLLLCLPLLVIVGGALEDERSAYAAIDLTTRKGFLTAYAWARDHHAPWIADAREVALQFVAYEYEERALPDTIVIVPTEPGKARLIMTREAHDDSIGQIRYRVDLIQRAQGWEIEWAGFQQTCARGGLWLLLDGRWGWHTKPCP